MKLKRPFHGAPKGSIYPVAYRPGEEVPAELLAAAEAEGAFDDPVENPDAVTIAPQRVFQMAPGPKPPKEDAGGRKGNGGRKGKQAAEAVADGAGAGNGAGAAGEGAGGADGTQDGAGDGGKAGDSATDGAGAGDGDGAGDAPPASGDPNLGGLG